MFSNRTVTHLLYGIVLLHVLRRELLRHPAPSEMEDGAALVGGSISVADSHNPSLYAKRTKEKTKQEGTLLMCVWLMRGNGISRCCQWSRRRTRQAEIRSALGRDAEASIVFTQIALSTAKGSFLRTTEILGCDYENRRKTRWAVRHNTLHELKAARSKGRQVSGLATSHEQPG